MFIFARITTPPKKKKKNHVEVRFVAKCVCSLLISHRQLIIKGMSAGRSLNLRGSAAVVVMTFRSKRLNIDFDKI